jgi:nicotinamidase-related amidase
MRALPDNAVLLVIDVQKGFDAPQRGLRNNPDAERHIARLLELWRSTGRPVIHVKHASTNPKALLHPTNPGHGIKDEVKPHGDEPVLVKSVNSCFIGTDLEFRLRREGHDTLVIVGLTTPHCVSTTARMAGNLGFNAYVVSDATAAFGLIGPDSRYHDPETVHALSLATLHGEFATVVDTEAVVEMVRPAVQPGRWWSRKHP